LRRAASQKGSPASRFNGAKSTLRFVRAERQLLMDGLIEQGREGGYRPGYCDTTQNRCFECYGNRRNVSEITGPSSLVALVKAGVGLANSSGFIMPIKQPVNPSTTTLHSICN